MQEPQVHYYKDLKMKYVSTLTPVATQPMIDQAIKQIEKIENGEIVNKTQHPKESENRQVDHFNLRMEKELIPGISLQHSLDQWKEVQNYAKQHQDIKYIIVNGIGGSYLGSYLMLTYLFSENYNDILPIKIYFCPNTDSDYFNQLLNIVDPEKTLILTISKSGSTAETATNNNMFIKEFTKSLEGKDPYKHFVAVTVKNSNLYKQAKELGYSAIFTMNESTGGRTSISTAVSSVICAFANIDFEQFLFGMRDMDKATRNKNIEQNPALQICSEIIQYTEGGYKCEQPRNYIMLFYSEYCKQYAHYCQQLYMESLGKEYTIDLKPIHTGLTVFGGVGTGEQHAFMQQVQKGLKNNVVKFYSFKNRVYEDKKDTGDSTMGRQLNNFLLGTQLALIKNQVPFQHIQVSDRNIYCLGQLIALEERIIVILGSWLNINAFDQPGVQDGKLAAKVVGQIGTKMQEQLSKEDNGKTLAELAQKFQCEKFVLEGLLIDCSANKNSWYWKQDIQSINYNEETQVVSIQ